MLNAQTSEPKDASAVVLLKHGTDLRDPEICWALRSLDLKFLGGYRAFPGGKVDAADAEIPVENCPDSELARLIACAARETFEEVGVLLARGGDKLTVGQFPLLHDDLVSGRMNFREVLAHWGLRLDAEDFTFVGAWTTPAFSPIRFRTRFFRAVCPPKQIPYAAIDELEDVQFVRATEGFEHWRGAGILCAPPVLNTLKVFSFGDPHEYDDLMLARAAAHGENTRMIELNPRVSVFPLRTPTLPPATHTNCFIVGRKKFVVIDAASADAGEQAALHEFIDALIADGGVCEEIIVSHLHSDHHGGEAALRDHILEKWGYRVPLSAHRITAESLPHIKFDRHIADGDVFDLTQADGAQFRLAALLTPGHARGHLCFYDEEIGFLISCDNVVGTGSVLIAPPEGDMADYLASLARMRDLPNLRFLCGSHGPAVANAKSKIESYIAHRLRREQKILAAFQSGATEPAAIVPLVYTDIDPKLFPLAAGSVSAHLAKLENDGLISRSL